MNGAGQTRSSSNRGDRGKKIRKGVKKIRRGLGRPSEIKQDLVYPIVDQTRGVLKAVNVNSGTGPDDLPGRILRDCAEELASPITILILRILSSMEWPDL